MIVLIRLLFVTTFIICEYNSISMSQTVEYEKEIMFSLNWGDAADQIGFRQNKPRGPEDFYIGTTNFTVTSNGLFWIYDVPQQAIKAFNTSGDLVYLYKLMEDAGLEGFIASDSDDNIWFHNAFERRIIKLNQKGKLLHAIEFESDEGLGAFCIINNNPVMLTNILIDIESKISDTAYHDKPVYLGKRIDIVSSSEFSPYRGKKTNRIYQIKDAEVLLSDGEVIPPMLLINNEAKDLGFGEYFSTYHILFEKEDNSGKIFIQLYPKKKTNTILMVYNEDCSHLQSIELPEPHRDYGFIGDPLYIDDNGTVYYMQLRSDLITFFKWSIK